MQNVVAAPVHNPIAARIKSGNGPISSMAGLFSADEGAPSPIKKKKKKRSWAIGSCEGVRSIAALWPRSLCQLVVSGRFSHVGVSHHRAGLQWVLWGTFLESPLQGCSQGSTFWGSFQKDLGFFLSLKCLFVWFFLDKLLTSSILIWGAAQEGHGLFWEQGQEAIQLQGELHCNVFFLPKRKVGVFVCMLITFSSSSFNLLKNTACREMFYWWIPFQEQSISPFSLSWSVFVVCNFQLKPFQCFVPHPQPLPGQGHAYDSYEIS